MLESYNGSDFVINQIVGFALKQIEMLWVALFEALVEKDPSLESFTLHRSV